MMSGRDSRVQESLHFCTDSAYSWAHHTSQMTIMQCCTNVCHASLANGRNDHTSSVVWCIQCMLAAKRCHYEKIVYFVTLCVTSAAGGSVFKERGVTYFFETYGCQMNIAESAAIEQQLIARGWTKSSSAEIADLAIINTCSVRATAENRIFGRLGWYTGLKALRSGKPGAKDKSLDAAAEYVKDGPKPLKLAVMGCMAERLLKSLQREWPCVDFVVGTFAKQHFGDIIDELEAERGVSSRNEAQRTRVSSRGILSEDPVETFASLALEPGAVTSEVPSMKGCNNVCTYCSVPYVRGREVSRPVSDILKELDELGARGVREVTLLGQNVNSYRGTENAVSSAAEKANDGSAADSSSAIITFPMLMQRIADHLKKTNSPIDRK